MSTMMNKVGSHLVNDDLEHAVEEKIIDITLLAFFKSTTFTSSWNCVRDAELSEIVCTLVSKDTVGKKDTKYAGENVGFFYTI